MKIFGVNSDKEYYGFGATFGIVIADTTQEAIGILRNSKECYMANEENIFEIPFKKAFTYIGSYSV